MSNKVFLGLLFLLAILNISNCTSNFRNLLLEDKSIEIPNIINPESKFHLSLNKNLTLPKYIQIFVKPSYCVDIINNYIILYYGDDINFIKRIQLSITRSKDIFPDIYLAKSGRNKKWFLFQSRSPRQKREIYGISN